jgi:cell division protein FtsW
MGSNTNLIPTKGMTLPFLSYGGSSMISSAITVGILLSLTRKNISHNPIKKQLNLNSANE